MPIPPSVTVKAGHVQPLWAGHPWVFKQAVERVDEGVAAGAEVVVIDPQGRVLGRGLYSPRSAIAVRLFTQQGQRPIDGDLVRARLEAAVRLRRAHGLPATEPDRQTSGYRLVHAEGDGLPGLIVDVFGEVLVVQLGTIGMQRLADVVYDALCEVVGPAAVLDRTPPSLAEAEGFELGADSAPAVRGDAPPSLVFHERGLRYDVPLELGQKTGFYFDQRPLRERIAPFARGSRVLDAFCYTGAVGLTARRAGASEVWAVDTSVAAIEAGKRIAADNELEVAFEATEAAKAFRRAADDGGWDIVICDPPKLSGKRRGRGKAMGAYRKLGASACAATAPGGLLAFCSCSGTVSFEALQRALALGARDADRSAVVVDRCFQGPDHPVLAPFPEGLYLKVLLARVDRP